MLSKKTVYSLLPLLLGLLAGCENTVKPPKTEAAFVLPQAAEVDGFELRHQRTGRYGLEQLDGRWALLFFGYTHCPDVCPTELFMLAEMMRGIEASAQPGIQAPQVVFVSVDPARDGLEALQRYAAFYHPDFVGVSGDAAAVDRLCRSIGVFYEKVYYRDGKVLDPQPEPPVPAALRDAYLINHSASIFLLNPEGRLHAIFTAPHDPHTLLRDLAEIQASWPAS